MRDVTHRTKTSSGVFHMLPMGLRVQEKLERLIDKHMRSVGKFAIEILLSQTINYFDMLTSERGRKALIVIPF